MSNRYRGGAGLDLGGARITQIADGVAGNDAVSLQQLQNALAGLAWKQPVRVATTTNGALATAYASGQTIDGVTLATGMRILLKDQTTGTENGIYTVNASGAPTRATDADSLGELQNATVYVIAGSVNADRAYTQTANDPTPNSTALVFAQVGGGTAYAAGNGLSLTGTTFAVVPKSGGGVVVDGTGVSIDRTVSGSKAPYAADVPSGSTSTTITHNLGTRDVDVKVYDRSSDPWVEVEVDVSIPTGGNTVVLGFGTAPTTGQYRVVIIPV